MKLTAKQQRQIFQTPKQFCFIEPITDKVNRLYFTNNPKRWPPPGVEQGSFYDIEELRKQILIKEYKL